MRVLLAMVLSVLMLPVLADVSLAAGDGDCDGTQIQQRDRDCLCDCDDPCDADGDGVCDNCGGRLPFGPSADGDRVRNGQDDEFVPPQNGTGNQNGR